MSDVLRYTAKIEGDFVVFIVGLSPNHIRDIPYAYQVYRRQIKLVKWLAARKEESGLYAWKLCWIGGPAMIQHWRSFEDLELFAIREDAPHIHGLRWIHRTLRRGGTSIWHETYKVHAGEYECIYGNTPRMLAARAGEMILLPDSSRARDRIK